MDDPAIATITTTLEDALYGAGNAAEVGIVPGRIRYYDFVFPNANRMMIFVRTRANDGKNIHQIEIPADYTLYEASYYHYAYSADDSELTVDGAIISDAPSTSEWWRTFDSYGGRITTETLHTIGIYYEETWRNEGSAGVATVLIYRDA